jgi:hypothetical protein
MQGLVLSELAIDQLMARESLTSAAEGAEIRFTIPRSQIDRLMPLLLRHRIPREQF